MDRFPQAISRSMRETGAMTTCLPLQFDDGSWETAVFFEVGGKECKEDRRILRRTEKPFPVSLEAETINHASACVVMLRFEVLTREDSPLAGEVLLTPGAGDIQFETLKCLTQQPHLRWYFADSAYQVIYSQQTLLHDQERAGYDELLKEAVGHDAVIRLTGKYSAEAAINEVVSHYQLRE